MIYGETENLEEKNEKARLKQIQEQVDAALKKKDKEESEKLKEELKKQKEELRKQ